MTAAIAPDKQRLRIADYDDPAFDPFATFDKMSGAGEVTDPWPVIHAAAARGPVQKGELRAEFGFPAYPLWSELEPYMVYGHEAVTKAYLDASGLSNEIMQRVYNDSFGLSINGMDAPDHSRYRRLFQQAFMPKTIAEWGAHLVPRVVNASIERFAGRGKAELVSEFTIHYPFDIIYAQLELPPDEGAVFQKLAVGLMCIAVEPERALEASRKMGVYLQSLLEERREAGGDDLIAMLGRATVDGERLPDHIAVSFLRQLLNASGDTTYRATGAMMVGLLTNPEQLAAVTADRSLVNQTVEEALRWDGPLTSIVRQATRDVELMGVTIPKGARVDVVQASSNRDAARYENPDRFDIFREPKRHTAFALGPHVCLGQHLAKMEMARALNALLDHLPKLRLDPAFPVPQVVGINSRAPVAVHVQFDA